MPAEPRPKKLLDQVREAVRLKHYSYRTEQTYVQWIRRYILFHGKRYPQDRGVPEIEVFLTHLAVQEQVAASTQNQALSALLFLYRHVLQLPLDERIDAIRAKPSRKLPTVLTSEEVRAVIQQMSGVHQLIVQLLYGSGLRLREAMQLRVKDLDFPSLKSLCETPKVKKVESRCYRVVCRQRLRNTYSRSSEFISKI